MADNKNKPNRAILAVYDTHKKVNHILIRDWNNDQDEIQTELEYFFREILSNIEHDLARHIFDIPNFEDQQKKLSASGFHVSYPTFIYVGEAGNDE
jgi:hypothetical protein